MLRPPENRTREPEGSAVTDERADVIFTGGAVYTVDAARRWAQAVAVKHGTITAVGTDEQTRALPPAGRRLRYLALQPLRRVLARGVRGDHRRVRGRSPGRGVDPGRRLVDGHLPGRQPYEGPARPPRAGPTRLPPQPRRAQRVGELEGTRERRRHEGHTRPSGWLDRAGRRRRAGGHAARGRFGAREQARPRRDDGGLDPPPPA